MPYIPDHIQAQLETPLEKVNRELDELFQLTKKGIESTPELADSLVGIHTCTSCRKWWPALFIGASIGFSAAWGIIPFVSSVVMWFLFWAAVYLYINHPSNTYSKDQPFKGKPFMRTVDSVLGSSDQNFIYYTCLIYCMAAIPPFTPAAIIIQFLFGWALLYSFCHALLIIRIYRKLEQKEKTLIPLRLILKKKI